MNIASIKQFIAAKRQKAIKPKPLKTLKLWRGQSTDQGTAGQLTYLSQHVCWMMELPDRDNAPNLSCIQSGKTYLVTYMPRSASGKYKDVYHVQEVSGRSGILIHLGNWAGDKLKRFKTNSLGCLLPATRLGILSGQMAGIGSRGALRKIHEITNREDFYLEVA